MSAMISLCRTGSTLHPFRTRSGITLKPGLITKKYARGIILKVSREFSADLVSLVFPPFFVRRFGHGARDLSLKVMLMPYKHLKFFLPYSKEVEHAISGG